MTKFIRRASAEARAFGRKKDRPSKRKRDDDLAHAPRIEVSRKPRFAPVTFSEEGGVRYLHFGTEWVQGAMRLRKPDHIELEYVQQMMAWLLFLETPARIVQLGLGAAALTKFCHRFLKRAKVEAVELNPAVVIAARAMFGLPYDDARLTVTPGTLSTTARITAASARCRSTSTMRPRAVLCSTACHSSRRPRLSRA